MVADNASMTYGTCSEDRNFTDGSSSSTDELGITSPLHEYALTLKRRLTDTKRNFEYDRSKNVAKFNPPIIVRIILVNI
jgi:hypothetical protein